MRAPLLRNRVSRFGDLPLLVHARRMSWNPVNLTGVENGVDAVEDAIAPGIGSVVPGLIAGCEPSIGELPEFNLGAFFSPSHLPRVLLRLAVGEPARVLIAVAHSYHHQMDGVAAAI